MDNVVRLEYAYGVCPKCNRGNFLVYLIRNDGLIHKPYEIKCINCNSYFTKEDIWGRGEETAPKPITNADCIRAMTDEELADALFYGQFTTKQATLDWLRQEATDADN